jgi:hypothetical protein
MKEGLCCFAQGCLGRRSRMKTWSPSYSYTGFLLVVYPKGLVPKIVYQVVSDVKYFIFYSVFVVWKWYYTVMSSIRDSYWSRDYHKGTGSRVFLTENPGRYRWCQSQLDRSTPPVTARFAAWLPPVRSVTNTGQTKGIVRLFPTPVRSVAAAVAQQPFQKASKMDLGSVTKPPQRKRRLFFP